MGIELDTQDAHFCMKLVDIMIEACEGTPEVGFLRQTRTALVAVEPEIDERQAIVLQSVLTRMFREGNCEESERELVRDLIKKLSSSRPAS